MSRPPIGTRRMTDAEKQRRYLANKALRPTGKNPTAADRAREIKARADLAELKAKRLAGELVRAEDVKTELISVIVQARAALLAVPTRVASQVPNVSAEILAAIDAEIRAALTALADQKLSPSDDEANALNHETTERDESPPGPQL